MILIKRMAVGLLAGLTVGVTSANAQYAQPQWGTGVWGGQQPCPYPVQVANGAQSYLDEYREVQKNLSLEQDTLERLEEKQRELSDLIEDAQEIIGGTIDAKYADFIIEHASNQRSCNEYQRTGRAPSEPAPAPQPVSERPSAPTAGLPSPPPGAADAGKAEPETNKERKKRLEEEAKRKRENKKEASDTAMVTQSRSVASVDGDEGGANSDLIPITGFTEQQWFSNCISRSKGAVNSRVCSTRPYNSVRKRSGTEAECKRSLLHLTNGYEDLQKVEAQIASTQRKISRLEDQVDRTAKSAVRRARTQTESGFCAMCEQYAQANRERAQWGSLATAGVGALLHFSERKDNREIAKLIAQKNSDNGWATQAFPTQTSGLGAMMMAGGLAGYISGGTGSGALGCATGVNGTGNQNGPLGIAGPYGQGPGLYPPVYGQNTGAFGYPPHILGPQQSGQMYMPGQGPWGPNGQFALNGNQGPVLVAPGSQYGNGYNNGSVPFGTVIGVDAFGNKIFSQGYVPGLPPAPGMPGYQPGMPMPNGAYNPYGYTNNGQGYATGPYAYQPGTAQTLGPYPYQPGGNQYGYNGVPGVPIGSIPTGAASGITSDLLRVEAYNLQNRAAAVGAFGAVPGYNSGYNSGYNYGNTGYYTQSPYAMPSSGYLSGNITIGGSYVPSQPGYNGGGSGTVNGVIVPGASR